MRHFPQQTGIGDLCAEKLARGPRVARLALLSGVALLALGAAQSANALTITADFDQSWLNFAPAGATAVVNSVIAEYQADFINPVTTTIAFGWGETGGSTLTQGASTGFAGNDGKGHSTNDFPAPFGPAGTFTLAQVKTMYANAVAAQPGNGAIATATANLPATYVNPNKGNFTGGTDNFFLTDATFKALTGGALNADTVDGFTGYATDFCGVGKPNCAYDFSGGPPGAGKIDFKAVVEHELSHALGRVDFAFVGGFGPPFLTPLDFFKYNCGTGTLNPLFAATCFSIDGGASNPGGLKFADQSDSGDWGGAFGDSFNNFISTGLTASVSAGDLLEMCALGWNDPTACPTNANGPGTPVAEPETLALFGSGLLGLVVWRRRRA